MSQHQGGSGRYTRWATQLHPAGLQTHEGMTTVVMLHAWTCVGGQSASPLLPDTSPGTPLMTLSHAASATGSRGPAERTSGIRMPATPTMAVRECTSSACWNLQTPTHAAHMPHTLCYQPCPCSSQTDGVGTAIMSDRHTAGCRMDGRKPSAYGRTASHASRKRTT